MGDIFGFGAGPGVSHVRGAYKKRIFKKKSWGKLGLGALFERDIWLHPWTDCLLSCLKA